MYPHMFIYIYICVTDRRPHGQRRGGRPASAGRSRPPFDEYNTLDYTKNSYKQEDFEETINDIYKEQSISSKQ